MNRNPTASNGAPVTVTLLGTGDAFSSFGRSQAGYLIDAPGGRIMLEAGPGVIRALKAGGVPTDSFDLLPVSHPHGHHFVCECTYYESSHLKFHLNYPLLAANRDKFKVRRMVLTHLGREVLSHEDEVALELGYDGMKITI